MYNVIWKKENNNENEMILMKINNNKKKKNNINEIIMWKWWIWKMTINNEIICNNSEIMMTAWIMKWRRRKIIM